MIKRLRREDTILMAVDFQKKLMPAMHDSKETIEGAKKMIDGFTVFDLPILVTEQNTKGLGGTVEELSESLTKNVTYIEKNEFSCLSNNDFKKALEESGRKTVIVTGCETHICVQQTVLDLLASGYNVYVAIDGVSSRKKYMKKAALARMERAGAVITTYEAVLFELLGSAKDPCFKSISKLVK